MYCSEEGSLRRPLHEKLRPIFSVQYIFRIVFLLVPEHANTFAPVHDQLISTGCVTQPPAQMVLFGKIVNVWCMVLIINAAFTPISVNVCQFVDGKSVLFIEGSAVKGFRSCDRLLWGLKFHERISVSVSLCAD